MSVASLVGQILKTKLSKPKASSSAWTAKCRSVEGRLAMIRSTCGKSAPFASTESAFSGWRRVEEKGRKNAGEGIDPTTGTSNSRQSRERSSTLMKTLSATCQTSRNVKIGKKAKLLRLSSNAHFLPSRFLMSLHCVNSLHLRASVFIRGGSRQVARSMARLKKVSGSL